MATPGAYDGEPPTPTLTVAAVARRLGVAPATLRTWDRRYGLGPTEHAAGAHRRYTSGDLERLTVMRRLTLAGVAPAEAARVAVADRPGSPVRHVPAPPAPRPDGAEHATGRTGGGRVVPLGESDPATRGLARAAMSLDSGACVEIVEAALRRDGVVPTWEGLLVPVLVGIGERWSATGQGIDVEHLLSEAVMAALRGVCAQLREPRNARPVLLCCAPEDQHGLPVHAVSAALAERGVAARLLGARVPREALADAVRRSGPAAVFVWSQMPGTADPDLLRGLPVLRPPAVLVAGGPGWDRATTPADVVSTGLADATDVLVRATGC